MCWLRLLPGGKEAKVDKTEAKEDKPEKNWGMWPAHGELIVKKRKWDTIARCVIQGRYKQSFAYCNRLPVIASMPLYMCLCFTWVCTCVHADTST